MQTKYKSIGKVVSCYPDKFGTPRQPGLVEMAWAKIIFNLDIQPEISLQGLEGFSHLWVIFDFHKNDNSRFHAKVHPPRMGGDSIGLFATRSPHRPNPIGLSLVEIIRVEKDAVVVAGADIIDGTPVLDIKPYLPEIESKPNAKAGWSSDLATKQIRIIWDQEHLQSLRVWGQRIQQDKIQEIIEQTLQLDPRPLVYRGFENQVDSPYRQTHAVRFFDGDVHFKFISESEIQILKILF